MSNRFKFRAWHEEDQKMLVVVGVSFGINLESDNTEILSVSCAEVTDGRWKFAGDHDADEVILMQSTGLKDKNGVEIFEGDIVTFSSGGDYIGVIDFDSAMFIVNWKQPCYVRKDLGKLIGINDYMEVIGNIHDNPKLMEGEE